MSNKRHSGRFRHIHAYSAIFRHVQTYPDIIRDVQEYSETWVTLAYSESRHILNKKHIQNPGISKTLAYSELETYLESWATQNTWIFRTGDILRTLSNIYDEVLWETVAIIIFANYNYFRNISFPGPLLYKINIIFLMLV